MCYHGLDLLSREGLVGRVIVEQSALCNGDSLVDSHAHTNHTFLEATGTGSAVARVDVDAVVLIAVLGREVEEAAHD